MVQLGCLKVVTLKPEKPSDEFFYQNATRITGKPGVIFFDGNAWHCGGVNSTNKVRRIITPLFSKPILNNL